MMFVFNQIFRFWKSIFSGVFVILSIFTFGYLKGKKSSKIIELKKQIKVERKKDELRKENKRAEDEINAMSRDDVLHKLFSERDDSYK